MTVREEIKDMNREKSKELLSGNVPQTMIMSPQPASFKEVGKGMRDLAGALDSVAKFAQQKDEEQRETERIQGSIERHQGKAYDEVKKMGRYTGEGWQIADVEIRGAELIMAERQRIRSEFYGTKPAEYAQKHLKRIDNELAALGTEIRDPVLKKHLLKQREKLLSKLAEEQTKAHIEYNYRKTVDSIPQRINAVLDAANSPEELKIALEDARELMKPGRFKVAPADVDRALSGLIQYRYDTAETPMQLNIAMELERSFMEGRPAASMGSSRRASASSASSAPSTGGYMGAMDALDADSEESPVVTGEYRSPATRKGSIQSARNKAIERVQSNQRIGKALETENFRELSNKEKPRALEGLWAKSMKEVYEDNPNVPEHQLVQAARLSYLQRLPATGILDPNLKESIQAHVYAGMDTKTPSDDAIQAFEDLKVLERSSSPAYLDKYIAATDKNFVYRALSYGNLSAPAALAKAAAMQEQIDKGMKFPKPSADMIKEAMDEMQKSASRSFLWNFAPDIVYNIVHGGDYNVAATEAELAAGFNSPAGNMFKVQLEKHAEMFLSETGSPQAAIKRAMAERKPYTALIGGVPVMTETKTWSQLTGVPDDIFEKAPELLNQAIMELLDERAGYSGLGNVANTLLRGVNTITQGVLGWAAVVTDDSSVAREKIIKLADALEIQDVQNYYGALGPEYDHLSDYSDLKIQVHESAGSIRINQWNKDRTDTISPVDVVIPTRLIGDHMKDLYRNKRKIRDNLR